MDKVQARIDETPTATHDDVWPEPQPLRRERPPSEPFPLDALGDVLSKTALAMQEVIQSPAAICGNSLLAGAALAVQAHADIVIDGRAYPVSSYFVTVAVSGERKTATDTTTLAPHAKRQRRLREVHESQRNEFLIELATWKKAREEALASKHNKTMQAKRDALRELGPEPTGPVEVVLMVEEPSYEGLVKALAAGWPSMGLFSDEGGRFLGGYGMNPDNLLKTAAGLSKLWDGAPITRTRSGDGNILLYGRRLSVHLMIQPAISHLLFGNETLLGQGLLSRFLVSWPETNIGNRPYHESDLTQAPAIRRYFGLLMDILEAPLPLAEGTKNELAPRQLPLSSEAKCTWIAFHDHVEKLCGEGRELHPVKGLAAKAAEHAARLAGVLTLVSDIHAGQVALAEMQAGIELAQFYLGEALRLFDAAADNPDLVLAERCLAWARNRGCLLTLPDLYQFGPNPVRDKETAKRVIGILEGHGWLLQIPGGAEVAGKRRRLAWEVHS